MRTADRELRSVLAIEADPEMSVVVNVTKGHIRIRLGPNGFLKSDDFRELYEGTDNGDEVSFGSVTGKVTIIPHPTAPDRELIAMDITVVLGANASRPALTVRKHLSAEVVQEIWLRVSEAEAHLASFASAPGGRRKMPAHRPAAAA